MHLNVAYMYIGSSFQMLMALALGCVPTVNKCDTDQTFSMTYLPDIAY